MNQTQHLLLLVAEECAEVAHRCSKAIRFGIDEVQPGQTLTNAQRLAAELTDLYAVVRMLEEATGRPLLDPSFADVDAKKAKVAKYMALSRKRGLLDD